MKITQRVVRDLLTYDESTGFLFWRKRDSHWFKGSEADAARWNTRYAGQRAFTSIGTHGYYAGSILGRMYLAHRIIWLYMTGEMPKVIDHDNKDRLCNRWTNLKNVSSQINSRNQKKSIRNTSGAVGVSWSKSANKWHASIRVDSKTIHLGYYKKYKDAVCVRQSAERLYGFHKNHGK